ncbi:hypothetical protein BZG82_11075 [Salinivibrio sp. PR5]|uniref:glycerophosphodiester phosphodiesterase family protein n=1 Tax=Salinivibrio sp. PR5 TaxID=1909484 RepID=UPI000989EAA9|nr:glycerophosphodiester phosphodiesterase family protein [Salinivibrio sp. PR5]OOF09431.1 hypothetical protein BZG82_11075 [Salinivibrio sp. PR5]
MKISPKQLCGHRGVAADAPENTLASIRQVRLWGMEWVEIDVQLTQDGVPVVFHDDTLSRCTNGVGRLGETPYAQLAQLDAGGYFDTQYQGERVPTLAAVLAQVAADDLHINIEIKTYPETDIPRLCDAVAATLSETGFPLERVLLSSFSLEALAYCQTAMPSVARAILWDVVPEDWHRYQDLATYSIHCHYRGITEVQAKAIKACGLKIKCYTPNHPEEVAHLWEWGVDMMITDAPSNYLGSEPTE